MNKIVSIDKIQALPHHLLSYVFSSSKIPKLWAKSFGLGGGVGELFLKGTKSQRILLMIVRI